MPSAQDPVATEIPSLGVVPCLKPLQLLRLGYLEPSAVFAREAMAIDGSEEPRGGLWRGALAMRVVGRRSR